MQSFSFRQYACILLIFLALGALVFGNAIHYPFVYDSEVFIKHNPHINEFDFATFTHKRNNSLGGKFVVNTYYRPLLDIIYTIQYRLSGLDTTLYHLFNIIVHILNAFLVYCLVALLLKDRFLTLMISLFYLLHPLQSGSVVYIASISVVLVAFFGYGSILAYLFAGRSSTLKGKLFWGILSLISFVLALFSKEQGIVVPFLIVLVRIYEELNKEKTRRKMFMGKTWILAMFHFGVLIAYFGLRKIVLGSGSSSLFSNTGELWLRMLSIPGTLLQYWRSILFPYDLHFYRCYDIFSPYLFPSFLLTVIVGVVIIALKKMDSDRRNISLLGIGWFFISLLPMLNIVPLFNEYSLIFTADHYLYIPLLGFFIFVAMLLKPFIGRKVICICLFILLTMSGFVTRQLNTVWQNKVALFSHIVSYEKEFGRAHILLGKAYYADQQYAKALLPYQKAEKIMKGYIDKSPSDPMRKVYQFYLQEIAFSRAHVYEALNDFPRAVSQYKQALSFEPESSMLYNNLGVVYAKMKDWEKALQSFRAAVRLDPQNEMALQNLYHLEKQFSSRKS